MIVISCPFCNAQFTRPKDQQEAGRVICIRCGESLPVKKSLDDSISSTPEATPKSPSLEDALRSTQANQKKKTPTLSRWILIFFFTAITLCIYVELSSIFKRTDHNSLTVPRETDNWKTLLCPDQLYLFGYLPSDTNALIAINGRMLTDRNDPVWEEINLRERLIQIGCPASSIERWEKATGIQLDQIHALVIGLRMQPFGLFLVAETKRPNLIDEIQKQVRSKVIRDQGESIIETYPTGLPFSVVLKSVSERILLASLTPQDLREIVLPPRTHEKLVPRALHSPLWHLPGGQFIWGAIASNQLKEQVPFLKSIPKLDNYKEIWDRLAQCNSVGFAIHETTSWKLMIQMEMIERDEAAKIRLQLQEQLKRIDKAKVSGEHSEIILELIWKENLFQELVGLLTNQQR
jgi:hypothetical protein